MVNDTPDIRPAAVAPINGNMSAVEWAKAEMAATNSRITKVLTTRAAQTGPVDD